MEKFLRTAAQILFSDEASGAKNTDIRETPTPQPAASHIPDCALRESPSNFLAS